MASASLDRRAWVAVVQFGLALGLILFLGGGTLDYWQGWAFLATFLTWTVLTTGYLLRHDRALVERRMRAGALAETQRSQKLIQVVNSALFIALIAVPALDRRFGWSEAPAWAAVLGDIMVAAGFWAILRVYQENSFAAATVEVAEGQTVVSTGPYALIRHPMYAAAMPLILGTPLALGSLWGLTIAAPLIATIVWRLLEEERFLTANLSGYEAYRSKVRFRLVPGVF